MALPRGEVYLRIAVAEHRQHWQSKGHFFAAAQAMRRILVENARRKKSLMNGGNRHRIELGDVGATPASAAVDLLALDEAPVRQLGQHGPPLRLESARRSVRQTRQPARRQPSAP